MVLFVEGQGTRDSRAADRLAAALRTQAELIGRLVREIETDQVGREALKHRIVEIESGCKKLREVI